MEKVRVRFAPSPTGNLHIGGARTALFNWLFARKTNGTFVLRIEDTDELRSTKESVDAIFEAMKWLELNWDEGPIPEGGSKGEHAPYFQGERFEKGVYQNYADRLLAEDKAYYCYCQPEELERMRKKAQLEKRPPRYDRRCRNLTAEQKAEFEKQGRKPVIRFKMPDEGSIGFNDLIRGEVSFENKLLYDFILVKASGYPTYNFACAIDDHLMKMTHVIRGDDHISNTPLQLHLCKALGFEPAKMVHLSMILGPDGTKLSKRHGHSSVQEYRDAGYLPETLRNYLALLGWSTPDSQQIFEKGELESKFDIEGCQKSPAIFDPVKLTWMNGEYLRKLSKDELFEKAKPFLKKDSTFDNVPEDRLKDIVFLEQEKYKLLTDVSGLIGFFFKDVEYDEKAVEKVFKKPGVDEILRDMKVRYQNLNEFNEQNLESEARAYSKEREVKTGPIFHSLRVATSGRTQGPTLFKMLEYLGKDEVVKRIDKALQLFF
jgi:nondiscriminating glutamyl-tRNA synthetase